MNGKGSQIAARLIRSSWTAPKNLQNHCNRYALRFWIDADVPNPDQKLLGLTTSF